MYGEMSGAGQQLKWTRSGSMQQADVDVIEGQQLSTESCLVSDYYSCIAGKGEVAERA